MASSGWWAGRGGAAPAARAGEAAVAGAPRLRSSCAHPVLRSWLIRIHDGHPWRGLESWPQRRWEGDTRHPDAERGGELGVGGALIQPGGPGARQDLADPPTCPALGVSAGQHGPQFWPMLTPCCGYAGTRSSSSGCMNAAHPLVLSPIAVIAVCVHA